MKCPVCGQKAVTLMDWGMTTRSLWTNCMSCGAKLKASPLVFGAIITSFTGMTVALILAFFVVPRDILLLTLVVGGAISVVCALVAWFLGVYEKQP